MLKVEGRPGPFAILGALQIWRVRGRAQRDRERGTGQHAGISSAHPTGAGRLRGRIGVVQGAGFGGRDAGVSGVGLAVRGGGSSK